MSPLYESPFEVKVMRTLLVSVRLITCSCLLAGFLPSASTSLTAAEVRDPEALLSSLEKVEFDLQHVLTAKDVSLRRDPFTITFDRGHLIFLRPVDHLVTGLYFWGSGTIVGVPPFKTERQQLNLFTGAPVLNEHFHEALIRFSDDTYSELAQQLETNSESPHIERDLSSEPFQSVLKGSSLTHYRIIADLMDGRKAPLFLAKILGVKLGMFDLIIDWRKAESVSVGQAHRADGHVYYNNWCSFSSDGLRPGVASKANRSLEVEPGRDRLIDVCSYQIDTQIDRQARLSGRVRVEYRAEESDEWVLSFDLSRFLKVSSVVDEKQRPLTFYQNREMGSEEELSRLGHDVILVLLKQPLRRGELKSLEFVYSGDVISRMGSGVYYVGARGSWYPNTGLIDRSRYSLSFHYPKAYTVVATGELVKEWEDAEQKHSFWESRSELPVAGFNYGDYVKKSTFAGRVPIEVYANRGVENVFLEVTARQEEMREAYRQRQIRNHLGEEPVSQAAMAPDFSDFDTTRFSDEIARQVARALLFFEPILGDFPFIRLGVSQIPGKFSQGWPSLLYVTSLSFLSAEQRGRLGIGGDWEANFLECLHAHEIAHQWWGNQVIWKSYHDLWMFEGFSNYFGYLFLNDKHTGNKPFRELMRYSKEKLLLKNSEGQAYETAGPLWLGARLASSKFPEGYANVIYNKGAWVLHMLRYLMRDPDSGTDQSFRALMKDFLMTYQGRAVSTEDFKRTVEKYIGKGMDLEGNRKMDWFFDQWVYERGIPLYRLEYSYTTLKTGEYQLKGKIRQQNVSEDFIMPVEVYGRFGRPNRIERLGRVVVAGNEANFRFVLKSKPQKVTLDENNEILCENATL